MFDSAHTILSGSNRRIPLLLLGVLLLAAVMVVFAWVETRSGRDEILQSIEAEAGTLISALRSSSESNILSMSELQAMLEERLRAVAGIAAARRGADLAAIARDSRVDALVRLDDRGAIRASSLPAGVGASLDDTVRAVLRSRRPAADTAALFDDLAIPGADQPMFAVMQTFDRGARVMIAGVQASRLLDVRRRVGFGRLIQNIGANPDIRFLVVQDEEGILAASRGVREMDPIETDSFLVDALRATAPRSRIVEYDGRRVMEVVQRFDLADSSASLMRLGISLENARLIQQGAMKRVVLMAAIVIAAGGLLIGFLLTRQRFATLRSEHHRVRSSMELVMDGIADAVIAVDHAGVVTVYNTAASVVFGRPESEVLGAAFAAVFPHDALMLTHTLETGRPVEYTEREFTTPTGALRVLGLSTSIIAGGDGGIDTVVAVARDLTERRRIQEQLERREKQSALGELAGGVAHEIRNPLNAISIIAQRFQREFTATEDNDEFRKLAATIHGETQRVNRIITQFLEFARPARLELKPCGLGDVIHETCALVESQARLRGISVTTACPADLRVNVDHDRFKQALLNVVQNGIEAMDEGGSLSCTVTTENGMAVMAIRDTGAGIPDDVRKHIFNLYFTTKPRGTGLGLSLVHQIVTEHEGTIEVRSRAGEGTEFRISIPCLGAIE